MLVELIKSFCKLIVAGTLNSLVFTGMGIVAIIIPIELLSVVAHLSHDVNRLLYEIAVQIIFIISFAYEVKDYKDFWE